MQYAAGAMQMRDSIAYASSGLALNVDWQADLPTCLIDHSMNVLASCIFSLGA